MHLIIDSAYDEQTLREIDRGLQFLLQTPKGSYPLDRGFGIDFDFLDKPAPVAANMLAAELKDTIPAMDPRVELDRVESQRLYMESELASVQQAYDEAQAGVEKSAEEIEALEQTKKELNQNISNLNDEKQALIKNIYALREGQVMLQAGQLITSVTVDEHMTREQSVQVLDSVLNDINTMLKQQMNISDENVNLIRISQADFDDAVNQVMEAKNKKLVRVVAAQNLIRGERLVIDFDIHDSRLIFSKGETIYKGNLDNYRNIKNYELQVLRFLKDLNHYAQSKGVLPDPITGNVGVLEGQELMGVIQKVKEYGGRCTLTVTAVRDVYSQGPLVIDVRVDRKEDKP